MITKHKEKWPTVLRKEDVCIECLNNDGKRTKPVIIQEGKYLCSKHGLQLFKKRMKEL